MQGRLKYRHSDIQEGILTDSMEHKAGTQAGRTIDGQAFRQVGMQAGRIIGKPDIQAGRHRRANMCTGREAGRQSEDMQELHRDMRAGREAGKQKVDRKAVKD
jgi:hypothetical protein